MEQEEQDARRQFDEIISAMQSELAAGGAHLEVDSRARSLYSSQVRKVAGEWQRQAAGGKISWAEAAREAQETRNIVMQLVRARSTPVGRALAARLKANGATLEQLVARQCSRMYGSGSSFTMLPVQQQNAVYARIVESAGRANPAVSALMKRASYAGRGLILLSLALAVYSVATANDKAKEASRQVALAGAGIAGSIASGALAGLACGPGAPVCVSIGAFVGGAFAALGVSFIW